ncbi:hypothetical protein Acr_22g0007290 [Actinidia rufa]|uniref:Uncharacterized protein n=1 Tax=Actinidia rufa TaxID=165716 RepID=A0A7J0GKR3_9ERIC|nr:hypothetical protein Acr_22g0007290 [Actinidia rufa]
MLLSSTFSWNSTLQLLDLTPSGALRGSGHIARCHYTPSYQLTSYAPRSYGNENRCATNEFCSSNLLSCQSSLLSNIQAEIHFLQPFQICSALHNSPIDKRLLGIRLQVTAVQEESKRNWEI